MVGVLVEEVVDNFCVITKRVEATLKGVGLQFGSVVVDFQNGDDAYLLGHGLVWLCVSCKYIEKKGTGGSILEGRRRSCVEEKTH